MGQICTCQNQNPSKNQIETEAIFHSENIKSQKSLPSPNNLYQISSSCESDDDSNRDKYSENQLKIKQLVETFVVQSGDSRDSWCIRIIPEDSPILQFKKSTSFALNIEKHDYIQKNENNQQSNELIASTQSLQDQCRISSYEQLQKKFIELEDQLKFVVDCIDDINKKPHRNFKLISFEEGMDSEFFEEESVPLPKETLNHGRFMK